MLGQAVFTAITFRSELHENYVFVTETAKRKDRPMPYARSV